MRDLLSFFKNNIKRLKLLALDCPECVRLGVPCRHYEYLKSYIAELEALPPFDQEKFDIFWKAYPRKVEKKYAKKVWGRIPMSDEFFKIVMDALEKFKKSEGWTKQRGAFIPHPTSWLNGERWNDEFEITPTKQVEDTSDYANI